MPQKRTKYKLTEECSLHHDKEWRWIPGFEDWYMASSCGDIRRHKSTARWGEYTHRVPFIQRQIAHKNRYLTVQFQSKHIRQQLYVHRLVLLAFVGSAHDTMEVAHLDGTRNNNHLSNLRWVTRKENANHRHGHNTCPCGERHPGTKLTDSEVHAIRALVEQGLSYKNIAPQFHISPSHVSLIARHMRRTIMSKESH